MITNGRACTVHKRWLLVLLLAVVAGCNQQGRYLPVVPERGGVQTFDTHTGTMYLTPRVEPPGK